MNVNSCPPDNDGDSYIGNCDDDMAKLFEKKLLSEYDKLFQSLTLICRRTSPRKSKFKVYLVTD